jgi:hypothetical protein
MRSRKLAIMGLITMACAPCVAYADDDLTSLSYISYLERYATVQPVSSKDTIEAQVNMPIMVGDRLETTRGARAEIQLSDGCTVWVDELSTVDFDNLAASRDESSPRTSINLAQGTLAIEIPSNAMDTENVRIDTSAGAVFLSRPGLYRLAVDEGQLNVETHQGLAELPSGVGSALLRPGQQSVIDPNGNNIYRAAIKDTPDDFWSWVEERRRPRTSQSAQYTDQSNPSRTAVLDSYGDWVYVDSTESWMWHPRVSDTWMPYSNGRWYWTSVGWTWIPYEPWGYYPSHYGSWYFDATIGWVWGWDSCWGPAWVHWMWADDYVGWCPRGYYDWWYYNDCHHGWDDHHHGGHGGDDHYHGPSRWSNVAYDLSGRVHLSRLDPRPWTIVPTDRFVSSHIDRVRVDTGRFLTGTGSGRDAVVRTGALVTPPRIGVGGRALGDAFRTTPGRDVPDLERVLGREPVGSGTGGGTRTTIQPTRTVDLVPPTRAVVTREGGGRDTTVNPARGGTGTGGGTGDRRGFWPPQATGRGDYGDAGRGGGSTDRSVTPTTRSDPGRTTTREPVTPASRHEVVREPAPERAPVHSEPATPPSSRPEPPARPDTPARPETPARPSPTRLRDGSTASRSYTWRDSTTGSTFTSHTVTQRAWVDRSASSSTWRDPRTVSRETTARPQDARSRYSAPDLSRPFVNRSEGATTRSYTPPSAGNTSLPSRSYSPPSRSYSAPSPGNTSAPARSYSAPSRSYSSPAPSAPSRSSSFSRGSSFSSGSSVSRGSSSSGGSSHSSSSGSSSSHGGGSHSRSR